MKVRLITPPQAIKTTDNPMWSPYKENIFLLHSNYHPKQQIVQIKTVYCKTAHTYNHSKIFLINL